MTSCKVCGKPAQPLYYTYAYCSWACADAPAVPAPFGAHWDDGETVTKLLDSDGHELARIYITVIGRTVSAVELRKHGRGWHGRAAAVADTKWKITRYLTGCHP